MPPQPQPDPSPKRRRLFTELYQIDSLLQTIDLPELQDLITEQRGLIAGLSQGTPLPDYVKMANSRTLASNEIIFVCAVELLRSRRELPAK